MKNWHRLNVSTENALKIDVPSFCHSNVDRSDIYLPGDGGIWTFGKDEIFNQEWIDYVQKTIPYIEITGALVFWRAPGYQHPAAHIDVAPRSSPSARDIEYEDNGFHATNSSESMDKSDFYPVVSAYNFTLDPEDDSEMTWYKPKEWTNTYDYAELKKFTNAVHYDDVPLDKLREVDSVRVGSKDLVMVRTNRLHNVRMGQRERWAISARAVMGWANWEEAVETLKDYIVE